MNLSELGASLGSDKSTSHSYLDIYESILSSRRNDLLSILEIGIAQAASLRMWLQWFPSSSVTGLDCNPTAIKAALRLGVDYPGRIISTIEGRQEDEQLLRKLPDAAYDIIVDDGGHDPAHQLVTFHYLWRTLKPDGFYFMEDLHLDERIRYWDFLPNTLVFAGHKNNLADDILVVIKKPRKPSPEEQFER